MFEPKNDGIDHINIYTKSLTELGKNLSNLYCCYPKLKLDLGDFSTLEGYWYSLKINALKLEANDFKFELETLKNLNGFKAKSLGSQIIKQIISQNELIKNEDEYLTESFKTSIKKAIEIKINSIKNLKFDLMYSKLPLTHYYYYGELEKNPKIIELPQHQWMIDYITELRISLKN